MRRWDVLDEHVRYRFVNLPGMSCGVLLDGGAFLLLNVRLRDICARFESLGLPAMFGRLFPDAVRGFKLLIVRRRNILAGFRCRNIVELY